MKPTSRVRSSKTPAIAGSWQGACSTVKTPKKLENNQANSKRVVAENVSTKKSKPLKPAQDSPNVLALKVDGAGLSGTQGENVAKRVATVAEVHAVAGIQPWASHSFGSELHMVTLLEKIETQTAAVQSGDMSDVEAMLFGQALTLQTVFTALARKGAQNLDTNAAGMELCLRLAFKAQSQCRATLETLAEVKNPRTATFIKQANVAGGHQQINNGAAAIPTQGHPHGKMADQPNELLTDTRTDNGKLVVAGTTSRAGKSNSCVEAMGTGHRAAHGIG